MWNDRQFKAIGNRLVLDLCRLFIVGVSCCMFGAIVIKDRSYGIDLYTEERRVYASGLGLVGDPVRLYDVIPVYMWMKDNFKGGLNNVMLMNKAPVDSRYHQRGGDNRQVRRTRASVNNRPISVWGGRFGYNRDECNN